MTQRAEQAVTNRAPAAMIAGAIPLIDVSGHLAGDAEASPLAGFKAPADLNTLHVAVRRPQGEHSSREGPGIADSPLEQAGFELAVPP